jgi:tRNA1(Val) A37 N6-methylase TrmN6
MDRSEQRKIFNKLKKQKEDELKLKTIERFGGEIYQMFLDGKVTLQQAYNHSKSEQLGVDGYKSKGTKGFVTNSKIVSNKPTPKLPYQKHPLIEDSSINITFHEINQMDYNEFRDYVLRLRKEFNKVWQELGIPPTIGKNTQEIINDFKSLYSKDVTSLYRKTTDKNYEFIIENNWKEGSTCNQFFPSIHKVRTLNVSLWDLFNNDEFELRWLRMMVRNLKQDYLYEFSKRFKDKIEIGEKSKEYGLIIHKSDNEHELTFTSRELRTLKKNGILKDYHLKNIESELERYNFFEIRYYKKDQRIFTSLIHILRVSFGNTPVNFHPQVSKFLYEHYLPKTRRSVVYDPCSGFGGRLLGCLLSDRKIHYIGTDVNTNLFEPINSYTVLGEFVKDHVRKDISFHIDKISSDEMNKSKELKKYMGKVDMVFTSPPYFSKERYSDDEEQSYKKYPYYKDWVEKYLHTTFEVAYKSLKKGGLCLVNISDITINTHSLPLELDTISTLENIGFKYQYQIGMKMTRYMGLNPSNILNRWWDEQSQTYKKVEPILVFIK